MTMNNMDFQRTKELFARIFVIAILNKINPNSFTNLLEKSTFLEKIESKKYDDYFNQPLETIFFDITQFRINKDESFGIYNDAYWCGYMYYELHQKSKKPFSFIFLKLPFTKMLDIYSIYHEMDFSSLEEYFDKCSQSKTILRALCEQKHCSISKLSSQIGVSNATLAKYNADDDALYKGNFQTIYKIAKFFDVPLSLFECIEDE